MIRRRQPADEVVVEVRATQLGGGFSGVVAEHDAELGLVVGDEVFGAVPAGQDGERFVVCRRRALARKPVALAHAEAALLAGLGPVALRAARLAGARAGERVLITGASGAVGAIVVQIAKVWGWRVTAVCADREVPLAWDLGADDVLARERLRDEGGRFVALIDTDSSFTAELAARLADPAGRLLRVHDGTIQVATTRGAPVVVQLGGPASEAELAELVQLVERGGVYPVRASAGA